MFPSSNPSPPRSAERHPRYGRLLLAAVLISGLVVGGWIVFGAYNALQAEQNLHASFFVISLVDEFVKTRGRWPRSWEELETVIVVDAGTSLTNDSTNLRLGAAHGYSWPTASHDLQQRIVIAFDVDMDAIASQNRMSFNAIRPIGPVFEYRDSPQVRSLQETLKSVVERGRNAKP